MRLLKGVSILVLLSVSAYSAETLPIPNADFERGGEAPEAWENKVYGGEATFSYEAAGRNGGRCVAIASVDGGDATWHQVVPIESYATYRLSAWIKTEQVDAGSGKGALINLHNFQPIQSEALSGTTDWTKVSLTFESDEQEEAWIDCLFGGWGKASGKAWYDDFKLELLERQPMKDHYAARIDLEKTGPPISKYIYSQFIEHLGRCIYGGIWAEMIEDRKFYYAVDAEESPWKSAAEGAGQVEMSQQQAYAGEQNVRLAPKQGAATIAQAGLGFENGKAYVGRIVLAADPAVEHVELSAAWGGSDAFHLRLDGLSPEFKSYPFSFTAGAEEDGSLSITARGAGHVDIAAVSLMPADHVEGMRPDTLALLKALNAPLYRWPGGNFVSGYDWRDGLGDPDRRPPRKNPAWTGVEHNDFGLHEFMRFCELLDTEAYIAVNSGLGDVKSAAEEVEYVNGAATTPMGRWRAEQGHPAPFQVRWWGIGNEMYGDWQLGHMPLEDYVRKHNRFAEAMRAVDPAITLVGVGATGDWSKMMLGECADHMEYLSEHFYCGERRGLTSHIKQIREAIRHKVREHQRYHARIPSLKEKRIPICMDEWNYWYGPHHYGELGTRYFLKDALGIAMGLNEYFRSSEWIYMANYAQTVNVIGCIKTTKRDAAFATTGLVLKLYRAEYGVTPVAVEGDLDPLDVAAALSADGQQVTLSIINPLQRAVKLDLDFGDAGYNNQARCYRIGGDDPQAFNEPGKAPVVRIEEITVDLSAGFSSLPPLSASLYCLDRN